MLFLMLIPPTSAHLETPVYSKWTTNPPTIDGVISIGEWTDAATRSFSLYINSTKTLSAKLYVKNDGTNIYAAVEVYNEDYDDLDAGGLFDGLFLFFDDNHNGNLETGENGEGATTWFLDPFYTYHDLYHQSWLPDDPYGGTEDGAMAWTHSNPTTGAIGDYVFEMEIPLVGTDGDGFDLVITSLPKTVGFKIYFKDKGIDSVYPDDPLIVDNASEIENGDTFGDLVLAGPPAAVGGMAAPIAIPIDVSNLLTPLIWLASAITLPIALTVAFVKLKKKKW